MVFFVRSTSYFSRIDEINLISCNLKYPFRSLFRSYFHSSSLTLLLPHSLNIVPHFPPYQSHKNFSTYHNSSVSLSPDSFHEKLTKIVQHFKAPISHAFAYGSGVFPQATSPLPKHYTQLNISLINSSNFTHLRDQFSNVIDLVFCVDNTQAWHDINLSQNRNHYSFLRLFGSKFISYIQDNWEAGIYFNPFVTQENCLIKYGVVNSSILHRDLVNWETLYMAGRLQKPVLTLIENSQISQANVINLCNALRVALLLLPNSFTERDLFLTLTSLSYTGDPRMSVYFKAENPHKIKNIVSNQLPHFRLLYEPIIRKFFPNVFVREHFSSTNDWYLDTSLNRHLSQDVCQSQRIQMIQSLPETLRNYLFSAYAKHTGQTFHGEQPSLTVFLSQYNKFQQALPHAINFGLRKIITVPSVKQSIKGLLTAGVFRSIRYMREKRSKATSLT